MTASVLLNIGTYTEAGAVGAIGYWENAFGPDELSEWAVCKNCDQFPCLELQHPELTQGSYTLKVNETGDPAGILQKLPGGESHLLTM